MGKKKKKKNRGKRKTAAQKKVVSAEKEVLAEDSAEEASEGAENSDGSEEGAENSEETSEGSGNSEKSEESTGTEEETSEVSASEKEKTEDQPDKKAPHRKKPWIPAIVLGLLIVLLAAGTVSVYQWKHRILPKADPHTGSEAGAALQIREKRTEDDLSAWEIDRYQLFVGLDATRDHEAPVISGAEDKVISIGTTVHYKDGVSAEDAFDGTVRVSVDNTQVNENEAGTYPVTYTAVDEAGNESQVTVNFTFVIPDSSLSDVAYTDDGYSEDELPVLAAELCGSICNESMSTAEKASAIYAWIWDHIGYSGYCYSDSYDESNMTLEAVAGLHRRSGNCFTFASISRALLDYEGIPNILVKKIRKEGRSDHFWLLVNIDGEWYHFDSTPRAAGGYFCLLTDEEMLEYSELHSSCFDFDLNLYPRTPGTIDARFLTDYPEVYESIYGAPEQSSENSDSGENAADGN